MLKDVGLGSLPGTSAEILDDEVRERISPGRISTQDWIRVIRGAHRLGLPATSTIMFGHVESPLQRARHLELLRSIQKETSGFTEFVPLSFIRTEAPMVKKSLVSVPLGAGRDDVLRMYAIARLMLYGWIDNIQASWVKQGPEQAVECLGAGANDFGGTLMNESISTSAGAPHGQFLPPRAIRTWIRKARRIPVQRSTKYDMVRVFGQEEVEGSDQNSWTNDRFGSYHKLIASTEFRFSQDKQLVNISRGAGAG
jgi:FO synthase subunit 2